MDFFIKLSRIRKHDGSTACRWVKRIGGTLAFLAEKLHRPVACRILASRRAVNHIKFSGYDKQIMDRVINIWSDVI
jgi:hypothetical protein